MKKFLVASLVAGSLFATSNLFAADGKALFANKGCTACHNPTKDQLAAGLGPSLKQVSTAYKGDEAGLVAFLSSKGKAKVAPAQFPIMQGQLAMLQGTSKGDLTALAKYIMSN